MSPYPRICVVSASGQNVFFTEILKAFTAGLQEHGFTVEQATDHFPAPAGDLVYLFVPHEYHPLVHELAHPTPVQLRRSVALCTEQPGSSWFDTAANIASHAAATVDINVLGTAELARRGIKAEHAPLGYIPEWDAWGGSEQRPRSISLAFLGSYTERRGRALARCVPVLGGRRSAIHMVESAAPHTADSASFLSGRRKWELLADTKVLINIHQDPLPYMEWHRIIGAAINGCVVLSEHSIGIDPFVPGEHFISSGYDDLSRVLHGVLSNEGLLTEVRHAAYELIREEMPMSVAVDALLRAIERASRQRVPPEHPPAIGPMPAAPPQRKPGWEANTELLASDLPIRTALKQLLVQGRRLERQVHDLALPDSQDPDEVVVEQLGPSVDDVHVSVLLTIYNYADYVGDALRSVALSDLGGIEVVAIDDASSDDSVDAVRAAAAELPWLPIRLVRRRRNHGLSAARNLAAEHARADLLFVLDADNLVLPSGMSLLVDALEAEPDAGFSYGLIETFDTSGPQGIVSWLEWDPVRLRYGNYVDAMALVRRRALEEVGGYSTDSALSMGWEDFALWIAMADKGFKGVRVPEFVARYRVNPFSMLSLTDIDTSAVWSVLLRKYPWLAHSVAPDPAAA